MTKRSCFIHGQYEGETCAQCQTALPPVRSEPLLGLPTRESRQYARYILNHYSKSSEGDVVCLARDLERHGWKPNASADGSAVADTVRRDVGLSEREIRTMIHHATVKAQVESDNFNGPKLGTATITDIIKDALEPLVAVILEPNNGGQP